VDLGETVANHGLTSLSLLSLCIRKAKKQPGPVARTCSGERLEALTSSSVWHESPLPYKVRITSLPQTEENLAWYTVFVRGAVSPLKSVLRSLGMGETGARDVTLQ
jgi:hypothetical protein